MFSLRCCFITVANAGIKLGCRRSGASEEDQRLRFCALRPARRCHPRNEGAQWKGLLPCRHSDDPASSQQNHHLLLHPDGGWFPHRGDSGQAGGQGQLRALHQRNRRTGSISADRLRHLLSRTGTALFHHPLKTNTHPLRTLPPPPPGVRPIGSVSRRAHVLRPTDLCRHAGSVPLSAGESTHRRSRFDQAAICPR